MAGAFSGHLVNAFNTSNQSRFPFGQTPDETKISIHGPMSFNPSMHGTMHSPSPFNKSMDSSASMMFDMSEDMAVKVATLQAKLDKKLGPEFISQRPGPGGAGKLTYAEGWKIINLANEVFGFNGWSTNIVSLTTDFSDYSEETRRHSVGVSAIIRVTLRDGIYHEDVGYGMLENAKSKGAALDKCKKEAVTDGVKRALRNFGNLLGNCLYDKEYTKEIVKVKAQPARFDKDNLHRRPEFSETKPNINNASTTSVNAQATTPIPTSPLIKMEPLPSSTKPVSAVPPHIKPNSASTPSGKSNQPMTPRDTKFTFNNPNNTNNSITRPNNQPRPQQQQQPQVNRPSAAPAPAPATVAGPSRPPQNPAPPPVQQPEPETEDAYSFPSDDEAFLAEMDLEADMGRPITYDDDTTIDNEHFDSGSASSGMQPPQGANSGQYRPALANTSSSNGRAPVQNQNNDTGGQVRPNGTGGPVPQAKPSSGGFNFPPGVDAQKLRTTSGPPQFMNANGQRSSGPTGVKRPADAMQQQQRKVGQGMGLSSSTGGGQTTNPTVRREPLGNLYVDGGDPKRLKR